MGSCSFPDVRPGPSTCTLGTLGRVTGERRAEPPDDDAETARPMDPLVAWGVYMARRRNGEPTPPIAVGVIVALMAIPTVVAIGVLIAMLSSR